jgi:hypothetical protein
MYTVISLMDKFSQKNGLEYGTLVEPRHQNGPPIVFLERLVPGIGWFSYREKGFIRNITCSFFSHEGRFTDEKSGEHKGGLRVGGITTGRLTLKHMD